MVSAEEKRVLDNKAEKEKTLLRTFLHSIIGALVGELRISIALYIQSCVQNDFIMHSKLSFLLLICSSCL